VAPIYGLLYGPLYRGSYMDVLKYCIMGFILGVILFAGLLIEDICGSTI
jgi:hypothetical protein